MELTNQQKAAFAAFGLVIMYEQSALLEHMTETEVDNFVKDVQKYLCPLVSDSDDLITPAVDILKEAIESLKGNV